MCKISVIIPVYNSSSYLEQCLDSVLGQSFMDFEVICVYDHSIDDSLEILYKYRKSDERILILENSERLGLAISRNRGAEIAKGEYIYFLDADDWIMPNALEILLEKAEQYNTDVILFNSCIVEEEEGLPLPSLSWNIEKEKFDTLMTGQEAFCSIVDNNTWTAAVWRQFWKKSFLFNNKIEFENKKSAEDWIFTTTSLLTAEKVVFINNILHTYRRHSQSGSLIHNAEIMKNFFLNYMSMLTFWMSHSFPERTNYSIKIHMERFIETIRYKNAQLTDFSPEEVLDDYIQQHLYQLITHSNRQLLLERNLDKDFVNKLKKYKYVYIYGASKYAAQMYEELTKWGVDIKGFVVTGFTDVRSMYGLSVKKLDDIDIDKESVVFVLGVSLKYHNDIIDNLRRYGFDHYMSL